MARACINLDELINDRLKIFHSAKHERVDTHLTLKEAGQMLARRKVSASHDWLRDSHRFLPFGLPQRLERLMVWRDCRELVLYEELTTWAGHGVSVKKYNYTKRIKIIYEVVWSRMQGRICAKR